MDHSPQSEQARLLREELTDPLVHVGLRHNHFLVTAVREVDDADEHHRVVAHA